MNRVIAVWWVVGCAHQEPVGQPPPAEADADTDADSDSDFVVPEPAGDPATVPLAGPCPQETRLGTGFAAQVLDGYSTVGGTIADAVVPITVLQDVTPPDVAGGECKLLLKEYAYCDPPCGVSETCDFDDDDPDDVGTCIPFPLNQDLGVVTVGGLVVPIVMRAIQPGASYFVRDVPHPLFDPGALIELRTWGTTFGSDITLHGVGVEPISLGNADWTLYRDQDLEVTWDPPTAAVHRSEVNVRLNIDQHGNTPVTMFCDFADDGAGTIPAALITALIEFQVTGFPNATVTRRTADSAPIADGCAEFAVSSQTQPNVLVDGYIPCGGPGQCPEGQECNLERGICE